MEKYLTEKKLNELLYKRKMENIDKNINFFKKIVKFLDLYLLLFIATIGFVGGIIILEIFKKGVGILFLKIVFIWVVLEFYFIIIYYLFKKMKEKALKNGRLN